MATIGTISTTFIARTKPFVRGVTRAQGSMRSFGKSVLNVTRLVGPLVLGGALIQLGKSVEFFNRAMQNSLAIMGDISDMMRKRMSKAAIEVARVTVFSARQVAEAFFFLASAGLNAAQSLRALPLVAKFAQAGMFDLAEATSLLTDAQSALGLKVKNITQSMKNLVRVSDLLVGANTLADATAREFAEALATVGGRVRLLGVELETAVAALAAFAERGIKGREAGTALDITLRELANKAAQNADAWDKLGIKVFDQTGKFRNLIDIIRDMEIALEGMSDLQKINAISMLGLTNKSNKFILQLIGASEEMAIFRNRLLDMGGITEDVANRQMTALQASIENLKGAFVNLGKEGSAAMEALAVAINLVADGVDLLEPLVQLVVDAYAATSKAVLDAALAFDEWVKSTGQAAGLPVELLALLNVTTNGFMLLAEHTDDAAEALDGATDSVNETGDAMESAADKARRLVEETKRLAEALAEQTKWQQFAEDLFTGTRTAIERYEIEIDKLNEALERGVIDWDLYQRGVRKAREELERATESSDDLVAAVEDAAEPRTGRGRQVGSLKRVALQGVVGGNTGDTVARNLKEILDKMDRHLKDIKDNQREPVLLQFE